MDPSGYLSRQYCKVSGGGEGCGSSIDDIKAGVPKVAKALDPEEPDPEEKTNGANLGYSAIETQGGKPDPSTEGAPSTRDPSEAQKRKLKEVQEKGDPDRSSNETGNTEPQVFRVPKDTESRASIENDQLLEERLNGNITARQHREIINARGESAATSLLAEGIGAAILKVFRIAFPALRQAVGRSSSITNPRSLADNVAEALGGTIKQTSNGKGFTVMVPNGTKQIAIRIMKEGGGRTNYYRISVPGKEAFTRGGKVSTDRALTHIDISRSSFNEIVSVVNKLKGGG